MGSKKLGMEKKVLILIVEDDLLNRELLEVFLKRKDLDYLLALDGLEALDIFQKHPEIDLVLLDIKLPNMNGVDVLIEMKKRRPNVPVIVQTAYVFDVDRDRFFAAGCDDYISKPISKDVFYEKLSHWLNIEIK